MGNMQTYLESNIIYLRNRDGLTRKQMAEIMGISTSTYRRIENMEPGVRFHGKILCRLADHFDCMVDELLFRDFSRESD